MSGYAVYDAKTSTMPRATAEKRSSGHRRKFGRYF